MRVDFVEAKTVAEINKQPQPGHFAIDSKILDWIRCRDQFRKKISPETLGFYFSHDTEKGDHIATFISKTEEVLDLVDCSRYAKTNRPYALWVEPSEFWMKCEMRRSLLTLLLRCGAHYNTFDDNYEEALYAEKHTASTKNAIMRFLFGFTEFKGKLADTIGFGTTNPNGWHSYWNGKTDEHIRRYLVAEEEVEPIMIGAGTLWI